MPLAQVRRSTNFSARRSFAVGAIEHIEESVAIRLDQQFAVLPAIAAIHDHRRLSGIPVIEIVRSELVMPFQFSCGGIKGEQGIGVKIVAFALVPVQRRIRIAGAPKHGVRCGIEGAGHPGGASAAILG